MFKNQKAPINNDNISQTTLEGARPISYGMKPHSHKTRAVAWVTLFSLLTPPVFGVFTAFAQDVSGEPTAGFFSRNLRVGERGEDVQILQKVLNSSSETKLTESGPGAPGEETTYFGELTKSAVVRFQEKYATDILFPIQLVQGTGFVGPMTRKKLNEAAKAVGITIGDGTTSGRSIGTTGSSMGSSGQAGVIAPKIFSVSPTTIINGTDITITGEGFTPTGNQVRTTYLILDNIPSGDGKTITFKFYAEQINALLGLDALKQDGMTMEDLQDNIAFARQESPEDALPPNASFLVPVYISVANKNGASNASQFNLDMDLTHNYLATSTVAMRTNEQSSLFKKISDAIAGLTITKIAEAKKKFDLKKWAAAAAAAYWASQIIGKIIGGSVGAAAPNFGGRIIMSIPCLCSYSTAFIILPQAGSPGPYNATWPPAGILENRANYALFPGNAVLGSHLPSGQCRFWFIYCFNFNAKEISSVTGVGTSLVP